MRDEFEDALLVSNVLGKRTNEDGSYNPNWEEEFKVEHPMDLKGHFISTNALLDKLMFALLTKSYTFKLYDGCYYCGEGKEITYNPTDKSFTALGGPCTALDGLEVSWTLDIPSGIMVADDDLRRVIGDPDNEDEPRAMPSEDGDWEKYNVNTAYGIKNTILWYAERKLAHGFVGNSCPGIYLVDEDHYQVTNAGYDETDYSAYEEKYERKTSICTDLWWYSIMDGDLFNSLGGELNKTWAGPHAFEVRPGRYQFDYHGLKKDFDRDDWHNDIIWTDVRWIGEL